MTQEHPITPPPELVEHHWNTPRVGGDFAQEFAAFFARWGADQELEASLEWLVRKGYLDARRSLPNARRPKPPSLKEQALEALEHILHNSSTELGAETIRRALEALDD